VVKRMAVAERQLIKLVKLAQYNVTSVLQEQLAEIPALKQQLTTASRT
jgi:hypothetical protein